jgi:hypothetical protein
MHVALFFVLHICYDFVSYFEVWLDNYEYLLCLNDDVLKDGGDRSVKRNAHDWEERIKEGFQTVA